MVLMYYMLLQKDKKKFAVTLGASTSKNGVVTVGVGISNQAAACGRLSSAGDATDSVGGATGTGASRKAKVVVVPTVKKAITRIAAKKQKKQ